MAGDGGDGDASGRFKRTLEGGEGVDARVVMEMIINPSASEKMAKGGLDIGVVAG
jgi:hypothetical protein